MAAVNLTWTPATGANITEQRIHRGTASNSLSLLVSLLSPTTSSYLDNTVVENTTYYYRVDSICTAGGPSGSNVVQIVAVCATLVNGTFTAVALDTANSGGPSTGSVVIGYGSTNTAGAAKSSGLATVNFNGTSAGGTICDNGFVQVTAHAPVSSFPQYVTVIRVYLNSTLIGTVYGPLNSEGGTVVQTFNYTRSEGNAISIEFDSEIT